MPLVILIASGAGYTHTHTSILSWTEAILRNQARAWFKKHYKNISNKESLLFGFVGSAVTTKLRIALNTIQFGKPSIY